jgi:hypothetical protein
MIGDGVRDQMVERFPACNMGFCARGRSSDELEKCVHVSREVGRGVYRCDG